MAIYPLSEIIFRTHELTNLQTKLCPSCLTENKLEDKVCSYCEDDIPNYTAETFIFARAKHISESDTSEIGIGGGADLEKLSKFKQKFNEQYDLWDRVILTAQFVNLFSMSRVDARVYARMFLDQFPLTINQIEDLQLNQLDLKLSSFNSSEIQRKLTDTEHRGYAGLFADFASWSPIFLNESPSTFITNNLRWMNITYGYYVNHLGGEISIDEKNANHLNDAILQIPKISNKAFNTEVILFPLHWKYVLEEKLYPEQKPRISKRRYQVVLEQWVPKTKAHEAWRQLGLHYCTNTKDPITDSIKAYRDQQLSLPFLERDFNFLFTLAAFTGEASPETLDFPYQQDSYFAPLMSLYQNAGYVMNYFLTSENSEAWLRALHYYDFSSADFKSELAKKILSDLSDDEYNQHFDLFHPSLLGPLFHAALDSSDVKKLARLMDKYSKWTAELVQFNIAEQYKKNSDIAKLIIDKSNWNYSWTADQLLPLLNEFPTDVALVDTIIGLLRKIETGKSELAAPLFKLWIETKNRNQDKVAAKYFDQIRYFMGQRGPFMLDENDQLPELKKELMSLWLSTNPTEVRLAEEFIAERVDPRGTRLEVLLPDYKIEDIFKVSKQVLANSKHRNFKSIAFSFIFAMMQKDLLSQEYLKILWDELPTFDSEDRDQLRYRLKEKLPPEPKAPEAPTAPDASAALREIEELKRQMAQMEQERKIKEERDRIVNEAREKSTRYQVKMAELQSWYQIEIAKVMNGPLDPTAKSKKITEISEEYQKGVTELTKMLS